MRTTAMSRRAVLEAGACALAAATGVPRPAAAHTEDGLGPTSEDTIRRWYAAWEQPDWHPIDLLLTDDFTFTSANNDDHIDKATFKTRCWQSQIRFIDHFELQRVFGKGNEALVTVRLPDQERKVVPQRGVSAAEWPAGAGDRVLLRRAVELSVRGEHPVEALRWQSRRRSGRITTPPPRRQDALPTIHRGKARRLSSPCPQGRSDPWTVP
jgi:ketosteroid isomerase-like protein